MKRFILGLLTIVGITLAAAPAFAGGVLTTETLNWRFANGATYSPAAPIGSYQLAKKTLVASANDTTTWVSTEGWFIPEQSAAGTDSVMVGMFVIQCDSTVNAGIGTNKQLTVTINGSFTANDAATYNTYSINIKTTDAANFFTVPIWMKHASAVNHPDPGVKQWGRIPAFLRVITTPTDNIVAARVFVQHLKPAK